MCGVGGFLKPLCGSVHTLYVCVCVDVWIEKSVGLGEWMSGCVWWGGWIVGSLKPLWICTHSYIVCVCVWMCGLRSV